MKIIKSNIWFVFLIVSLVLSCREEIIAPENFVGKVNEPVQINDSNSYSFFMDARDISINVTSRANFSSNMSRISISIFEYLNGSVFITVFDAQETKRFSYTGNGDVDLFSESFIGWVPGSIAIRMLNFSGNLKIEMKRTF